MDLTSRLQFARRGLAFWLPAALAIAGISLSVILWQAEASHHEREVTQLFATTAEDRAHAIERELEADLSVVSMLGGLINSDDQLDPSAFFGVGDAVLDTGIPIEALEWIPLVTHEERQAFETRVGFEIRERDANGALVRAADRATYFPVTLVNPLVGNEAAEGFDLGSSAVRLESLELARDSGELQVTHRIRLIQETGDEFGFLAVNPVFRSTTANTVTGRRDNLLGFTSGEYHASDLIDGALSVFDSADAEVIVLDRGAAAGEEVFATYPTSLQLTSEADLTLSDEGLRQEHHIQIGAAEWTVVVQATPGFGAISAAERWGALVGGLVVTALVVALLRLTLIRAERIKQIVVKRTEEVRLERDRYQSIFDNAQVGIFTTGPDNILRTVNPAAVRFLDQSAEELLTQSPLDLVAPSHHELMTERRRRRDAGESVDPIFEVPLRVGTEGDSSWFSVHLEPMFGPGHVFEGIQGVFNDISEEIARREELTANASRDALTGAANRRRFDEFLDEQVQVSQRYGTPVSLILLDLDHFKRVNDTHGHQAGDEVLQAVAEVLDWVARDADLVARYGGEEFTVVLPHTDADGAAAAGERCRAAIEAMTCSWEDVTLRVTASVGVATYDRSEHASGTDLVRDADGAAYAAKRTGRNKVRVANDLAPPQQRAV